MMGSFEKLGILVIVVIIVMILAVAIYQWGATGVEMGTTVLPVLSQNSKPLIVDYDDPAKGAKKNRKTGHANQSAPKWDSGIPKSYVIQNRDIVWKLVVKRWRLKEKFIEAIKGANPSLNMKRLRAGDTLVIPDPQDYVRRIKDSKAKSGTRTYKIRDGDRLESIAKRMLGKRSRWREIQSLNPGMDPAKLGLGDTIFIPLR